MRSEDKPVKNYHSYHIKLTEVFLTTEEEDGVLIAAQVVNTLACFILTGSFT